MLKIQQEDGLTPIFSLMTAMTTLTKEYLDEKLETFSGAIKQDIAVLRHEVKSDIAEIRNDITTMQETLANLVTLVDKFTKIYAELNQELIVLRQHVRDMEVRIEKLEVQFKAA